MLPLEMSSLKARVLIFVAGGPLASFALSIAALSFAAALDHGQPKMLLMVIGATSGLLGLLSLVPTVGGPLHAESDGQLIWGLLAGDQKQLDAFRDLRLLRLLMEGVDASAVAIEALKLARPPAAPDADTSFRDYVTALIALECGDQETVQRIFARTLDPGNKTHGRIAFVLLHEMSFFEALHQGRPERAESQLLLMRSIAPDECWKLLESVIHELRGRRADAVSALDAWSRHAASCRDRSFLELGERWVVRELSCRLASAAQPIL